MLLFLIDDPFVSSEAKDDSSEDYQHSEMAEETINVETEYDFDPALQNITDTFSREKKDNDKMRNFSFKNKGRQFCAYTVILIPCLTILLVLSLQIGRVFG